ncbi:MAG TPA: hypothetical protein VIH85_23620, partial [Solirubrobacteraceae bacterium]
MSAVADSFEARFATAASGLLRAFNQAGLLSAADVHVASRLAELTGEDREAVLLAAALAVRGPRLGNVFVDLATIRDTAVLESEDEEAPVDVTALPWPAQAEWTAAVATSALVAVGEAEPVANRPLRL